VSNIDSSSFVPFKEFSKKLSYLFLNGEIIKCLSRPKNTNEMRPYRGKTVRDACFRKSFG